MKLDVQSMVLQRESSKFVRTTTAFLTADRIRERVSFIARRNKHRTILVVYYEQTDNPLATTLLQANSNAIPFIANGVTAAIRLLRNNIFDMIYAVMPMEENVPEGGLGSARGPCFFSLDHPTDQQFKKEKPHVVVAAERLRPFIGEAELVAVCGQSMNRCPIAQKLFEDMLHESGERYGFRQAV